MASITRYRDGWRAQVFVGGRRKSKVCRTKGEAAGWAARTEQELGQPVKRTETFAAVCDAYLRSVAPTHRGERWERVRLRKLVQSSLGQLAVHQIDAAALADWRDKRLLEVSPASVLRELNLLRSVLESCRRDWGLIDANPVKDIRKPTAPAPRRRRVPDEVVDAMLAALGYVRGTVPLTASQRIAVAFLLALETGMRSGEMLGLTWSAVREKSLTLPKTKNGDARQVPLSLAARELLALLPRDGDSVFRVNAASRDALWRKARAKALEAESVPDGLADLHFHDSRSEAVSRLSSKIDVMELARIIGHRDINSLLIYYAVSADDLADKLS